ncbi:MAG: autotransporter domain-containing protein [Alphaproteobacteria bacterium]|nr:autotransporter domain-containing protein [Alphaproteobacteria bacterium]
MSNIKHLADLVKVCSILPVFAVVPAFADEYQKQSEQVISADTIYGAEDSFSWVDTSTTAFGGLDSVFYILAGNTLTLNTGAEFTNNKADVGIFSTTSKGDKSTLNVGKDVLFENNVVRFDGGAIANFGYLNVDSAIFRKNKAQTDFENNTEQMGGGAIALGSESVVLIENATFEENESMYHGGAIAMRGAADGDNSAADLDIIKTNFTSNVAKEHGGAIYSTFYDSLNEKNSVYIEKSNFTSNKANRGGAIYNNGELDKKDNKASMKIVGGEYKDNIAAIEGGAIYNAGSLNIVGADFVGNKSVVDGGAIFNEGVLSINGGNFKNNIASKDAWSDGGYAGAIFDYGKLEINGTKFDKVAFENNVAYAGGAIYGSRYTNEGMDIEYTVFKNNHALTDAGALGIFNNAVSELTNVWFEGNTAAVAYKNVFKAEDIVEADGGGAIHLGQYASATLTNAHFEDNVSGVRGGAIAARHYADETLKIIKSEFDENISYSVGGAIANVYAGKVEIESTEFTSNVAKVNGGAIFNGSAPNYGGGSTPTASTGDGKVFFTGSNTFEDNIAGVNGGAIYNDVKGVMDFSGTNTFVNNKAGKHYNDIHNLGTITVSGGTMSLTGGITGDGKFTLENGAVLNMGASSIIQSEIVLDGTVYADVLTAANTSYIDRGEQNENTRVSDSGTFAKLFGNVSGNGTINLNVGSAGTYKMFNSDNNITIDAGKAYTVTNNGKDGVVIEMKSVETLTADTGISQQAAGAINSLANSTNRNIQMVSLAAQKLLNSDDADAIAKIEQETAKLNPEDKPVTTSVASTVNNQVLTLTSGRMAGATTHVGRAGGDKPQENGFWAQGLYNKSKSGSAFSGDTRGFALGADTLIDGVYTLGAGFACNNTEVSSGTRDTEIDSQTLFLYGQYKPSKWFLNTTLAYTMAEHTENADPFGVVVESTYDSTAFGAQMKLGYDFATGLTPEIGFRYLHIVQDEYDNGVNTIAEQNTNFLTNTIGLRYSFYVETEDMLKFRPEMRAALTYDVIRDGERATVSIPGIGASYNVDGESISAFGGEVGIGLTAEYKGLEFSVMYDLDVHEAYTSQTGMFKFRSQF